ncbi:MAG: hypothetical protein GDA67_01810 [Nitrospira sp. CR1.3]|nr:hypothetical protein [Nitrospira sp. CR1.3]
MRYCGNCDKHVYLLFSAKQGHSARLLRYGCEAPDDHDLCDRCYRSLTAKLNARRMGPKPNWAIRATLKLMHEAETDARRIIPQ